MAGWETGEMANALPVIDDTFAADASTADDATKVNTPAAPMLVIEDRSAAIQEHGWVAKTGYDYNQYNKTNKELQDEAAANGHTAETWAADADRYEWQDEYGDVGPRFPELEKMLFGSEFHVRSGIDFNAINEIQVVQEGPVQLNPIRNFAEAGLHPVMKLNVQLAGYDQPTPVQAYALPAVHKGHDLIACAQTGSGKTAAFLIPIINKLMGKAKKLCAPRPNPAAMEAGEFVRAEPLVVIVCPSRELATQIFDEARRFCYRSMFRPCVIYGGGPRADQINQLRKGCDILIGTPGRLCDFIECPHILTLRRVKYMVIDEADEMLSQDWEAELKKIMSGGDQEEGNIKYLMFSATFPKGARNLAKQHLAHDHVRIRVGRAGSSHKNIKQTVLFVDPAMKRKCLADLLLNLKPARTIIFVNSKRAAEEVDDFLFNSGYPSTSIHSDRTQREREDAIRSFRTGKCPIIVATGVSARGLDIRNIMHVINYDMPSQMYGGIDEYIHRIGRTGRIGNQGLATSFFNDRDADLGQVLTKVLLETRQDIPDFLTQYLPEDYDAENKDTAKLNFDDDSEEEEEEAEGACADTATAGGSWGDKAPSKGVAEESATDVGAWGGAASKDDAATDGWGAASGGDEAVW